MIRNLRWLRYRIPYAAEFATAHGRNEAREGLILWLTTDTGTTGLGEVAPVPGFGGGTVEDAARLLGEVAPGLIGMDLAALPAALAALLADASGTAAVRCGLDVAALDAEAQAANLRVADLLATEVASSVPVNATIGTRAIDGVTSAARRAVDAGFGTLKLKVGVTASLEAEVARVAAVREVVGPDIALRLDVNGAWAPEHAIAMIRRLEEHAIDLVEQPVPAGALHGLLRVRHGVDSRIAADESVTGLAAARWIVEEGAADALVIKPMVVGGLRPARAIIDLAAGAGVETIVTSTIDTGIGVAAALHLAATLSAPVACGLATSEFLVTDLLQQPPAVRAGQMAMLAGPGLGIVLDERAVARYSVGEVEQVGN